MVMTIAKVLKHSAAIGAIAAVGALAVPALASPGSGVTPTTYVTSNLNEIVDFNHNRIKFQTKDAATV
jgi:hypothetical protein